MPHLYYILFVFALGACIGSFLNVVVYRLPAGISLVTPASHCPQCKTPLAWYDNIPVLGWILLRGRCRYCRVAIPARYPIVEAVAALLFVFYYVMFFMAHAGPCAAAGQLRPHGSFFWGEMVSFPADWPIYLLYMALISGLLAASLIDAELFIIPAGIPWWIAGAGIVVHAFIDGPNTAGALLVYPPALALSAGAALGLGISIILLQLRVLPISFPEGDLLESERAELEQQARQAEETGEKSPEIPAEFTSRQIRAEMRKEMLFLMPPLVLAGISFLLFSHLPAVRHLWIVAGGIDWLNGGLGALLGGMVGALVVWLTRILGSYAFGREAMGLGDVHLMFGVGAVLGAGAATLAFFLAPFIGILAGLYLLITRSRRQLPYGPYLSLACAFVMLFYCPIVAYLGLDGLAWFIRRAAGEF